MSNDLESDAKLESGDDVKEAKPKDGGVGSPEDEARVSPMELDLQTEGGGSMGSEGGRSDRVRVSPESGDGNVDKGMDSKGFKIQGGDGLGNDDIDDVFDIARVEIDDQDEDSSEAQNESVDLLSEFDEYVANEKDGMALGTSRALSYGFEVGDMVWGKVKSHPWWPGHIFNEAFATSQVRRTRREGHVLVAFFGDSSYGWFDPAELIPFEPHFAEKSRQTNYRNFNRAVEEAVDEASRRCGVGFVCKCRNPYNFRATSVPGYFVVDVPDYEHGAVYSTDQIRKARDGFNPAEMVALVKQLASSPVQGDQKSLSFIMNKATLFAYRKAVFEEYDETYAQAFGARSSSRNAVAVSDQPVKPRAPLSGPLVIAEALGGRKSATKSMKVKDHSKKDKYLFKRRDEASNVKSHQSTQGQASSSAPSAYLEGSIALGDGDFMLQKRAPSPSMKLQILKHEQTEFMSKDASGKETVNLNQVPANSSLTSQGVTTGAKLSLKLSLDKESGALREVKEVLTQNVAVGPASTGCSDLLGEGTKITITTPSSSTSFSFFLPQLLLSLPNSRQLFPEETIMSDPEEDRGPAIFPKSKNLDAMDFDIDVSWPLDQIQFLSNPTSPLLFSPADDPCSPLWAFPDVDHDKLAGGGGRALPDPAQFVSDANPVVEKPRENEDNRMLPSPFSGLDPNPDGYFLIKERITQALRYLKESSDQHVLAQVWAPVKDGSRYVLTTSGQPFVLDPHDGLHQYRMVSLMYMFSVDGENDGVLGLPGRVFQQKMPEWTPNVQYYSIKEYPRLDHAQHYNVQGTLALPIFEPSGRSCIGVIELIMTSQKINYAPEVDKICKALEAVSLKSSEILDHTSTQIQIRNEGRQNALTEILEILTMVCETHKLPLAQTWVPCMHRNVLAYGGGMKKSCTSFDGSCMEQVCMSTTDVAVYIVDAHMWGFREACVEHHLQKGQGVAGRAFLSRNACFCRDISQFRKTEYPLVHYARMFELTSSFAICLQSTHTGNDDYILEFFLPPSIRDSCEQQTLLGSILAIVKDHCQNLKVASGIGLAEEGTVEIVQASINEGLDSRLECIQIPCSMEPLPGSSLPNREEMVRLNPAKPQLMVDIDAINDERNAVHNGGKNNISVPENKDIKKTSERKRGKTEKSISLEVLQQYFAGSLKDAAKSLGVCPTTMKRICRQHGISRWPSRKINKVNRSLSKLKLVIESVQGGEGAFGLSPLTTSPLTGAVGSISRPYTSSQPYEVQGEKKDSPSSSTPGREGQAGIEDPLQDIGNGSNSSKTGSGSREASTGTPTSHGSCQGSPANGSAMVKDPFVSSIQEQFVEVDRSPESAFRPPEELYVPVPCSIPDALLMTEPEEPYRGMLLEDAGSSKDLRNLCPFTDITVHEQVPEVFWTDPQCPDSAPNQSMSTLAYTMPHNTSLQEMRSVTIKAAYKDDIIRFRISMSSCIVDLKEEVAKRLKLEVGTFDMKYMDDDLEWVLIACDADLQECMEICRSSGSNMIRLSVHDILSNLGSSSESTEE